MSKKVSEEYSELMHYTTGNGLSGIISSGCIWATHSSFLNDAEEIKHFFDTRLVEIVREEVSSFYSEMNSDPAQANNIIANGGFDKVRDLQTENIVDSMRSVTLEVNQSHIVSLCSPRNEKVRENGLLSQWRGYGKDGGYAIVFDAAGFEGMLTAENADYHYQYLGLGDVFYYGYDEEDQASLDDVAELEVKLRETIGHLLHMRGPESIEEGYFAVTALSCAFKHWGFHEEREVRLVAIPVNTSLDGLDIENNPKQKKIIKYYSRDGLLVPYIEMFSRKKELDKPTILPIKRIMIGPHKDKENRKQSVEMLLKSNGYDVEVVTSAIPYIGR